jgi:hypothetical protein
LTEFRRWVEGFVRVVNDQRGKVEFFNLAPRGAVIDGMPFVDFNTHRTKFFVANSAEVIGVAPPFSPELIGKVTTRVKRQVQRLKELQKLCDRALAADGLPESKRTSRMLKVVSAAKKCPEVSAILNKQLIGIEERRQRVNFDADPRLMELLLSTSAACDQVLSEYEQTP